MFQRYLLLALLIALPSFASAQQPSAAVGAGAGGPSPAYDAPMVHSPVTVPAQEAPKVSTGMKIFQAVSWYIPNRIADLFDVPKLHLALGSGLGGTLRATKYFFFSYFDTETYCIGWGGRKMNAGGSIFFHERMDEKYLGFLAAQQGKIQRDPSEVGLSLHLWAIGLNFALSGAELIDAATGLVGIDLMGDDHGPVLFDRTEKKAVVVEPPPVIEVTPAPAPAPAR